MAVTSRALIDRFLDLDRIAVVGVSRDPKDFTRALFREIQKHCPEAVPVNPAAGEIEGRAAFARLTEVRPLVKGALLLTPPEVTDEVVRECVEAGVEMVWMHQGAGTGAVSPWAVGYCETHGVEVIAGECPFMFLPGSGWFHRLHGTIRKLTGKYPT